MMPQYLIQLHKRNGKIGNSFEKLRNIVLKAQQYEDDLTVLTEFDYYIFESNSFRSWTVSIDQLECSWNDTMHQFSEYLLDKEHNDCEKILIKQSNANWPDVSAFYFTMFDVSDTNIIKFYVTYQEGPTEYSPKIILGLIPIPLLFGIPKQQFNTTVENINSMNWKSIVSSKYHDCVCMNV
jgi:hypothetical protein